MFTTYRSFYIHGREGDDIGLSIKEHSSYEKAVAYAERYSVGPRFVRVTIDDENGNEIYELLSNRDLYINGKKI